MSPLYATQLVCLTIAMIERQQKFAFVLNKFAIYEYPVDVYTLGSITCHKHLAESQDFIKKAKKYQLVHEIDAAMNVLIFSTSCAINEEIDEDGCIE